MSGLVACLGVILCIIGMMFVVGGTVMAGLFLPGVIVLIVGLLAFAVAGALPLLSSAGKA